MIEFYVPSKYEIRIYDESEKWESIENGFVIYNPTNGNWQWKE
jgi:hypothetical protein